MKRAFPVSQILRFGLVGGAAAGVHVSVFLIAVERCSVDALWANFGAWVVAFIFSFSGHFYWTFDNARSDHGRSAAETLPRFLAVSLLGLMLNSLVVVVVELVALPYGFAAILMATLVPGITFGVSRAWAFR